MTAYTPGNGQWLNGYGSFAYDGRGYVAQATANLPPYNATVTENFGYDALGRRVESDLYSTAAPEYSHTYLHDGETVIEEQFQQCGSIYLPCREDSLTGLGLDERYARSEAAGQMSLLTDAQGNVIATANPNPNPNLLNTQYTYSPYGTQQPSGSSDNPYTFARQPWDANLALYFMHHRYYNPQLGRFISRDPAGFSGGDNLYAYAGSVGDKGLLAMDESNPTCNKRFALLGIPQTGEARRAYRELIVTTPGLGESISGAILYDETIRQTLKNGMSFVDVLLKAGIIPGIKVDLGAKDMAGFPGEKVTEGLDGLRVRVAEYSRMGARFAKWRAVIAMGDGIPSRSCIEVNARALARYAALCQEAGLVPVVEPEVLMEGEHNLERCFEVTEQVLRTVFIQLYTQRVTLEGMIVKPNMVLPGLSCPKQAAVDEVADATVKCLLRAVPAAVPGIAFLSGGQSVELASARLNAMNVRFKSRLPWALAFSFARAIQQPALEIWQGNEAHVLAAQQALYHRARCNRAARRGEYNAAMD